MLSGRTCTANADAAKAMAPVKPARRDTQPAKNPANGCTARDRNRSSPHHAVDVLRQTGHGYGQVGLCCDSPGHDLYVLAGIRESGFELGPVEIRFEIQDETFHRRVWGMPDSSGSVVCGEDRASPGENIGEFRGTRGHGWAEADMRVRVQMGETSAEPLLGCGNSEVLHGDSGLVKTIRGPIAHDQFHRLQNLSAAALLDRAPGAEEALIEIMAQDVTRHADILLAECHGNGIHDRVTDRVWMPESFAFDDFVTLTREREA